MDKKNKDINLLVENFNNLSVTLIKFIATLYPRTSFATYKPIVEKLALFKSTKMIDKFVIKILLPHESQILAGSDSFYMGQHHEIDTEELQDAVQSKLNQDVVSMNIFKFDTIWETLSDINKSHVKLHTKQMCQIARLYTNLLIEKRDNK